MEHRYLYKLDGAVAQLGAHLNGIEEVRGSSPLSSTTIWVAYVYARIIGDSCLGWSRGSGEGETIGQTSMER